MTDQPAEGCCELCSQQRLLFPLTFKAEGQEENAHLCTRCHSCASRMAPIRLIEELFYATGGAQ